MTSRYLALDIGDRRTGVAATDYTGTIIVPLPTLHHRSMDDIPDLVAQLVTERETEVLIIGIPLLSDGSAGPQAQRVLQVATALQHRLPHLTHLRVDESHSTTIAHDQLKAAGLKAARRRRHADALAAMEILRRATNL